MRNEFDELPQVIYVATPERSVNYQWAEESEKISRALQILTKDDVLQLECKLPKRIYEGDILVLHPFEEDLYINVNDLQNINIKYAKFFAYKQIAQNLGATHYEVIFANKQTTKRELNTENEVIVGEYARLEFDLKREDDFKKSMGFSMSADFTGVSTISQESYNKAKELVKKFHLETDEGIKALIASRNPSIENPETYEEIACDMMNEINSALDVAFSLKAAGSIFSLDSKTSASIENCEVVKLTIKYTFPEKSAERE